MTEQIKPDFTMLEFLTKLKERLAVAKPGGASELNLERWAEEASYRTHVMCGNAVKGREPANRDTSVLAAVMEDLRYSRDEYQNVDKQEQVGSRDKCRLFGFEWYKLDLVAATSPRDWGEDVWRGEYRLELALEVENNINEFTLHMRGLYDFRAEHRVGIFYVDSGDPGVLDSVAVGIGREVQSLGEWIGPTRHGKWGVCVPENEPVTAIFLSLAKPEILGVRQWLPDGPTKVIELPA